MAARNKVQIEIDAEDKASSKLRGLIRTLADVNQTIELFGRAKDIITGVGGELFDLAKSAASVEAVSKAFEGLTKASGKSSKEMLAALEKGSAGMIAQRDLMKSYNLAAQLVGDTFANQLPDAMGYLSKVSAATGQDMGFLMESLVRGVGRLSPLILDNLGIQVDLNDAYQVYADSIGKSVDSLTKQEQQTALTNQVMKELAENTANMPELAGTAAAKFAEFDAKMQNLRDTVGMLLLPAFSKFLDVAIAGLTWLTDNLPKVGQAFQGLFDLFFKRDYTKALMDVFGWAEDAPIVDTLFRIRDAIASVIDPIATAFSNLSIRIHSFFDALKAGPSYALKFAFGIDLPWLKDVETTLGKVSERVKVFIDWLRTGIGLKWSALFAFNIDLDKEIEDGLTRARSALTVGFERLKLDLASAALDLQFDQTATTVRNQLEEAFEQQDWSAAAGKVGDQLSKALSDIKGSNVDVGKITSWAQGNMDVISRTIISVAGIVFGGPFGAAIGIANLISLAIETDFLGLATFLKESGITDAVEGAFNDLKNTIEGLIESIFGGGESPLVSLSDAVRSAEGGVDMTDPLQRFAQRIRDGIKALEGALAAPIEAIKKGLGDLGTGISGFIANLSGADASGILDLLTNIGGAIAAFFVPLLAAVGMGAGIIMSSIGAALPSFGSAIADFISMLSAIGLGDWDVALEKLGGFIANLAEGIVAIPVTILDEVLTKIGDFLGIDLSGFKEQWDLLWGTDLPRVVTQFRDTIQGVWDSIKAKIEAAWNWIKTNILDPIIKFVNDTFGPVWTNLRIVVEGAWNAIVSAIQGAWNIIKGIFDAIIGAAADVAQAISDVVNTAPTYPAAFPQGLKPPGWETPGQPAGQQLGGHILGGQPVRIEPRVGYEDWIPDRPGTLQPAATPGGGTTLNIYFMGTGGPLTPTEAADSADLFVNELRARGINV